MTLAWRKVLLYLSIAIMELSWIYFFLVLLSSAVSRVDFAIAGPMIAYPVAFIANLMLRRLKPHRFARRAIDWVLWAIVMLLIVKIILYPVLSWADAAWLTAIPFAVSRVFTAFHPELFILIGTAVVWWFGSRLTRVNLNFRTVLTEFQFGLPALLILFVIAFSLDIDRGNIPVALLFFFFALLGLALSHERDDNSWFAGVYRSQWSVLIILTIAVVLGLGLLMGSLISKDFVQLIVNGIAWVWNGIVNIIEWLANLIPVGDQSAPPPPETSAITTNPSDNTGIFRIPEQLRQILGNGWAIVMMVLFVIAVWRIAEQIYAQLRKRRGSGGATIETVRGGFKLGLVNFFKWLAGILRIRLPQKQKPEQHEVVTVRHLYRQLLHWADTHGLPRRNNQTTDEYLTTLTNQLPDVTGELSYITKLYNEVRYGRLVPRDSELNELKENWQRIKSVRKVKPFTEPIKA